MDGKVTIDNILFSLENLKMEDGDIIPIAKSLNDAKANLFSSLEQLEEITVKGKESLSVLLGCIFAIEQLLGKGE